MHGACLKFIAPISRELFEEYAVAERYCREAPGYSLVLLRDFAYRLAGLLGRRAGIRVAGNLHDQLQARAFAQVVPESMRRRLDFLRLNGNIGAHPAEFRKSPAEFADIALKSLQSAHELAAWFCEDYCEEFPGEKCSEQITPFQVPEVDFQNDIHRQAVMDGDARACYRVGLALLERARAELEKNQSESRRGETRRDGRSFVFIPEDFRDAAYWFRKADRGHDGEKGGHAGARYQVGLLLMGGLGVERDEHEGEALIYSAAEEGHVDAMCRLGGLFYHGSVLFSQDYERAFEYFRRAADEEHPGALTALTRMYKDGQGVERDLYRAFEFAERAARAGFPSARYSLGLLYLEGRGVKRSIRKAVEWFRLAARDGHEEAALALYRLRKSEPDQAADLLGERETLRLLLRAFRGGNAGAAYELGTLHAERDAPDHFRVVNYYTRALEQGARGDLLEKLRGALPRAVQSMRRSLMGDELNEQRFHACTLLAARFDENGFPIRNNPFA